MCMLGFILSWLPKDYAKLQKFESKILIKLLDKFYGDFMPWNQYPGRLQKESLLTITTYLFNAVCHSIIQNSRSTANYDNLPFGQVHSQSSRYNQLEGLQQGKVFRSCTSSWMQVDCCPEIYRRWQWLVRRLFRLHDHYRTCHCPALNLLLLKWLWMCLYLTTLLISTFSWNLILCNQYIRIVFKKLL